MTKFFIKIKNAILKHKIRTTVIIIILAAGGYYGYPKLFPVQTTTQYITQPVAKTTITVSVSGSGQVSEENGIDLKPALGTNNSIISAVNFKTGDLVKSGQVVATIDQKNNLASLRQAQASVANAQANYDKLIAGASAEDIRISQNSVTQAETSYKKSITDRDAAKQSTALTLAKAQKALDDLITLNPAGNDRNTIVNTIQDKLNTDRSSLDSEDNILTNSNLKEVLSVQNSNFILDAQSEYNSAVSLLATANNSLSAALSEKSDANIDQACNDAAAALAKTAASYNDLYQALQSSVTSTQVTQSQLDSYKSSANSQVSGMNSAVLAIQTARQNFFDSIQTAEDNLASTKLTVNSQLQSAEAQITSAYNSWQSAKNSYDKLVAPATVQDIASAKAQLSSASSQLQTAQTNFDNNIITAPFDGMIAAMNVQKGDQVGGSTVIATIITENKIATMSLNEVDAAKVKVGDKVIITFDAIDGLSITGKVAEMDTIGTVSQGVVTYNIKISFDTQDDRVKPSMSANAEIITSVRTDVLAVPNSAVNSDANGSYVQLLVNGQPQAQTVQTGIANDTMTEITSGLDEGDQVVTQTITSGGSGSSSQTANSSTANRAGGGNVRVGGGGGFGAIFGR